MVSGKNWLRHEGDINLIFDEMLLTGITVKKMSRILIDRQLMPTEKKAIFWIQRHLKHLKAEGKTECDRGHKLPLIESSDGRLCFDLNKMELMLNGSTRPVSNLTLSTRHLPQKHDVEFAESQLRKTTSD
jgi:hypothetical protein